MIKTFSYKGIYSGPTLLVLGAVHGNERSGTESIYRLIRQFQKKEIILQSGTLLCAPIVNQQAYDLNQRYVDQDLNRVCQYRNAPCTYEQYVANNLTTLIDQADIVVDLHSFHSQGDAFVCDDYPSILTQQLVESLPISYVIQSWQNLSSAQSTQDTMKYAHKSGKSGILIEGGNHNDVQTIEVLYESIVNIIRQLNMIAGGSKSITADKTIVVAKESCIKEKEGSFIYRWKEFDYVVSGEELCRYGDGTTYMTSYDAYILIPNHEAKIGDEWFYLGVKKS